MPVSLLGKMFTPKLIHYLSNHLAAFGFKVSSLPNNIVLNAANKKTDQSLSDFQTCMGATAHANLKTRV